MKWIVLVMFVVGCGDDSSGPAFKCGGENGMFCRVDFDGLTTVGLSGCGDESQDITYLNASDEWVLVTTKPSAFTAEAKAVEVVQNTSCVDDPIKVVVKN